MFFPFSFLYLSMVKVLYPAQTGFNHSKRKQLKAFVQKLRKIITLDQIDKILYFSYENFTLLVGCSVCVKSSTNRFNQFQCFQLQSLNLKQVSMYIVLRK